MARSLLLRKSVSHEPSGSSRAVIAASISFLTLIGTLAAQYFGRRATGKQLDRTLAEQRTRTLNERFATAGRASWAVTSRRKSRLAGVYAMAGLAEVLSRLCYFVSFVLTKSGTNRQLESVSTRLCKIRSVVARNYQSTGVGSGPFPAARPTREKGATGYDSDRYRARAADH
jgi:hypothetical protein